MATRRSGRSKCSRSCSTSSLMPHSFPLPSIRINKGAADPSSALRDGGTRGSRAETPNYAALTSRLPGRRHNAGIIGNMQSWLLRAALSPSVLTVLAAGQQQTPPAALPQDDTTTHISVEVTRVSMAYSVTDKKGRFVTGFSKEDRSEERRVGKECRSR